MYRRRRSQREKISFSFDSFLDVVTNVIGIIIRLILATWIGARAYTTAMMMSQEDVMSAELAAVVAPPAPPSPEDDPVSKELTQAQRDIAIVRARLVKQLQQLDLAQAKEAQTRNDLTLLGTSMDNLEKEKQKLTSQASKKGTQVQMVMLTVEQMNDKAKKLRDDIQAVEKLPTPTKELRFRTPVSRPVRSDEVFFECRAGRVTFIDLPAFLREVRDNVENQADLLRDQWQVKGTTGQIGPFRMGYVVERRRSFAESFAPDGSPPKNGRVVPELSGWFIEPITADRGETVEKALAKNSQFRQIIDGLDAQQSVVTLWVYPDSFSLFRPLRDFMHDRDIEVAGRPLPFGTPIAATRHGSASRGQ